MSRLALLTQRAPRTGESSEEQHVKEQSPTPFSSLYDLCPPSLVYDEPLTFRNAQHEGSCLFHLFRAAVAGPRFIALLTQESGQGEWSLTNGIEAAVFGACRTYGLDPAEVWWVEHYDDRGASPHIRQILNDACERTNGELFRRVTFTGLPSSSDEEAPRFPQWETVEKFIVERWIGQTLR